MFKHRKTKYTRKTVPVEWQRRVQVALNYLNIVFLRLFYASGIPFNSLISIFIKPDFRRKLLVPVASIRSTIQTISTT